MDAEIVANNCQLVKTNVVMKNSFDALIPVSRGLKIAMLNINSLNKHISELQVFMSNQTLDILAINETKLDYRTRDQEIDLPGYFCLRKDRDSRGGGVCIYLKNSIKFTRKTCFEIEDLEMLSVEIKRTNSSPFLFTTWYRPPKLSVDCFDKFEIFLKQVDSIYKEIYILGDLNVNLLANSPETHNSRLSDLLDNYQLTQIIDKPTRITPSSKSLIDLLITSDKDKITSHGVYSLSISDHHLIYATIKVGTSRGNPKIVITRNLKIFYEDCFKEDLKQTQWPVISDLSDVNEAWLCWKNIFLETLNKHAPFRKIRTRNKQSPWITRDLKEEMQSRDLLLKRATKSANEDDWLIYRQKRNRVNKLIFKTKKIYYEDKLNKHSGDVKRTWKTINEIRGKKSKNTLINEIKTASSEVHVDSKRIANALNFHFTNIAAKLASELQNKEYQTNHTDYLKQVNATFSLLPTNPQSVEKLLKEAKADKATGLDGISNSILKLSAPFISKHLSGLFNLSIRLGSFPNEWKTAKVTPIFKSGGLNDPNNYRPISVTSTISRIFEKIIFNQIELYISNHDLLYKLQSGFRPQHSTLTALLDLTNEWSFNIDRKMVNGAIFLDLKKAFDTVDHQILLSKLRFYGFDTHTIKWFKSYLCDRTQQCFVNGLLSDSSPISYGVPQGTILGPTLFLLYINDFPNCIDFSRARLYADDTSLSFSDTEISSLNQQMKTDLQNITSWLHANKLTLNTLKSEFMLIGTRQRLSTLETTNFSLRVDGVELKRTSETKCLGVQIDENLTWSTHIQYIKKKVSCSLATLKKIKPYLKQDCLIIIYNSIIEPYFNYCCLVWDGINDTLKDKLQKLQNRAARIITGAPYLSVPTKEIFKRLNWKSLENKRLDQKAIMMFKIMNGLAPSYLSEIFHNNPGTDTYHLRCSSANLKLPKVRTEIYKRGFTYSAAKL